MPALDLDFLRDAPSAPWMRWLLLAVALTFASDLGLNYYRQHQRLARNHEALEARRHDVAAAASARSIAASAPSPEEIKMARDALDRLSMPWGKLFGALETATGEKVALLAIEPDVRTGTVLITGEAADYRSALDYVSALDRTGTLQRPHLVHHERNAGDPQSGLRFSISAAWRHPR